TICNLHYRRTIGYATCRRCQSGAKTSEHLFRNCSIAKETWERLNIVWPASEEHTNFTEWLKNFFESHSIVICRMFVCALWGIRTSRNRFIHEGEMRSGSQVADFVTNYLHELDGLT
ncbi:hypothetical protein E1A91_A12G207400v1, partial [Gossypium mustelinum]